MKRNSLLVVAVAMAVLSTSLFAADKKKKGKLDGIKCPISGNPVKEDKTVAYKKGKVYFCCGKCPTAFKKLLDGTGKGAINRSTKLAKANHQLVATGQAKQVKCPIRGKKLNPDTGIKVAGVKVTFCCNGCKGKATKVKGDTQIALVFGDKAFAKGFKVGEKKKE